MESTTSWRGLGDALSSDITLADLDRELACAASLTEEERSVIWLYAWSSRETAMRVAALSG